MRKIQTTAKDIPFVFVGELYNLNATIFWINIILLVEENLLSVGKLMMICVFILRGL